MTADRSEQLSARDEASELESPRTQARADLLIAFGIVLATLAAYARVFSFGFVAFDDGKYIYNDIHLSGGLTFQTLKWVFLSFSPDNWFPVTRLSLFADYSLFGLRPGAYHAENLSIHIAASLLLFGFLRQATQARWPSAFAAFMFALHPLHVESVAWISERKDVLCAFFWFATLWAWLRYTERPGKGRYASALVLFSLGLMSKPMIVSLPFLLLLLDVWPLRRALSKKLVAEKIPFLVLSFAVMAITVIAQQRSIQSIEKLPAGQRVENALITVAVYIAQTLWPARLWVPRTFPRNLPLQEAIAAAAGIVAVSAVALRQLRKRSYLAVGWFWFLGTLIPVIGLLQVGLQPRADRYMYVPMVGLSIMLAWGAAEVVTRRLGLRVWASVLVLGIAACIAMAVRTSLQTKYWENSETLFHHAIDMDSGNYLAWEGLADYFAEEGDHLVEAISCHRTAVLIRPDDAGLHTNLATVLCEAGRTEEGIGEFREALRVNPDYALAHSSLAGVLATRGRRNEAVDEYETALRLDPRSAAAHANLGVVLWNVPGRSAEGLLHMERAVEIDPDNAMAQSNLGNALLSTPDRFADGIAHLAVARQLQASANKLPPP